MPGAELARRAEIGHNTLWLIEQDTGHAPRRLTRKAIAEKLKTSVEHLFWEEPDPVEVA